MAQMERWKAWVQSLGDAVVNPGTPFSASKVVTTEGAADDPDLDSMKGFAVVKAENLDEAIRIARSDPFLQSGGTIRVHAMMEM